MISVLLPTPPPSRSHLSSNLNGPSQWAHVHHLQLPHWKISPPDIIIYTEGSVKSSPPSSTCAIYIPYLVYSKSCLLLPGSGIFSSELYRILRALEKLYALDQSPPCIHIFSQSFKMGTSRDRSYLGRWLNKKEILLDSNRGKPKELFLPISFFF
jgi:hypothetical protein